MKRISRNKLNIAPDYNQTCVVLGDQYTGIGPHTGYEVSMMIAGYKNALMTTSDSREYAALLPYLKSGFFREYGVKYDAVGPVKGLHKRVVIVRQGHEWRAKKLAKLYKEIALNRPRRMYHIDHIKIGIILGYSNEEIRKFIEGKLCPSKLKIRATT